MIGGGQTELAAVILTTGSRSQEVITAIKSLTVGVGCEILVVWNSGAVQPRELTAQTGIRVMSPGFNLGIPGGRVFGARQLTSDIIVFLDDDAVLLSTNVDSTLREYFNRHQTCAVVSFSIIDEQGKQTRRHNPRVGTKGNNHPGPVGTFLGGACAIRRSAFNQVGGYDTSFFYSMEEQDLSWKLWAAGWEVHYKPDIVVRHPRTDPSRHEHALLQTWRNRLTAVRRSLPFPVRVIHLVLHGTRAINFGLSARILLQELRQHPYPPDSNPMSWRTVAKLTKIGRPPVF